MPYRINVTLSDEVHEALKGFAEFVGKPTATVAGDLIREMYPTMDKVTKAMKKAKKDKTRGISEMRALVIAEISRVSSEAVKLDQVDLFDNPDEEIK